MSPAAGQDGTAGQARSGLPCARASISRFVRRMLHQSLCSATGMPHSTQIRTRWGGWVFLENSFLRIDMSAPFQLYLRRILLPEGLLNRSTPGKMHGKEGGAEV